MRFHEVPWNSMGFYNVSENRSVPSKVSDMRAIGESEGYKRGQEQLLGTLRTAQDSREIRQNLKKD
jgi:hypothetical protein